MSLLRKVADAVTPGHDPLAATDRDMKKVLDALASLNPKPIEDCTPEEARRQPLPVDAVKKLLREDGKDPSDPMGVATQDISIPGAAGLLKARSYRPEGAGGDLPTLLYFHGGGWVIAGIDAYDSSPRAMAKMTGALVISCDYRYAPEHKFPAAHEDAFAAYKWLLANAANLGGDPAKIAVMGESAGGNLAINVSIAARDHGVPLPCAQVLVYPVAGGDDTTPSYEKNAQAKPLNKAMMHWFIRHVFKTEADSLNPHIDLVGRAKLQGLPATTLINAEIDPLCSEGEALAAKLQAAGVPVNRKTYSGVTHEFFGMGMVVAKAKEAEEMAAKDLKKAFLR